MTRSFTYGYSPGDRPAHISVDGPTWYPAIKPHRRRALGAHPPGSRSRSAAARAPSRRSTASSGRCCVTGNPKPPASAEPSWTHSGVLVHRHPVLLHGGPGLADEFGVDSVCNSRSLAAPCVSPMARLCHSGLTAGDVEDPQPRSAEGLPPRAPGRIRTCDTRFRRAVLYPLSYEGGGLSETLPETLEGSPEPLRQACWSDDVRLPGWRCPCGHFPRAYAW